jgi:hypothetical protein
MRFWMCFVVIVIGIWDSKLRWRTTTSDNTDTLRALGEFRREVSGLRIAFDMGVHRPVTRISRLALLGFSGSYFYNLDASVSDEKLRIPSYFGRNLPLALNILPADWTPLIVHRTLSPFSHMDRTSAKYEAAFLRMR